MTRVEKILALLALGAWCIMMIAGYLGASTDSQAASHPDHRTSVYTEPLELKGRVRYVTPAQKRMSQWGRAGFIGGWVVLAGAIGVIYRRNRREKDRATWNSA